MTQAQLATADQMAAAQQAVDLLRVELDSTYFRGELSEEDANEFLRQLNGLVLFLNLKPQGTK